VCVWGGGGGGGGQRGTVSGGLLDVHGTCFNRVRLWQAASGDACRFPECGDDFGQRAI
jgi:hypothetical protein